VDWYGDREPFLDRSYALLQSVVGGEKKFQNSHDVRRDPAKNGQATDDTLAAFEKFTKRIWRPTRPGAPHISLITGAPMIFIFPKSMQTDWNPGAGGD